jgi:hypothetical protein
MVSNNISMNRYISLSEGNLAVNVQPLDHSLAILKTISYHAIIHSVRPKQSNLVVESLGRPTFTTLADADADISQLSIVSATMLFDTRYDSHKAHTAVRIKSQKQDVLSTRSHAQP